jgi:hypothetical protein
VGPDRLHDEHLFQGVARLEIVEDLFDEPRVGALAIHPFAESAAHVRVHAISDRQNVSFDRLRCACAEPRGGGAAGTVWTWGFHVGFSLSQWWKKCVPLYIRANITF